MSKRRKAGEIVLKKENVGFVIDWQPHRCRIEPEDKKCGSMPCLIDGCDDENCREWITLAEINDAGEVIGYFYHVSECQMKDESRE